ncbi:MAG: alkene reductase [Verrucomicrobiota bacterium]
MPETENAPVDSPNLLSSFNLHGLPLANRVVLAPMTRARAGEERLANATMAEYYAQRAAAGLLITEATVISEGANGWVNTPGIYTDEMAAAWKQVVDAVHAKGSRIFLQLWHCGRASHPDFLGGDLPVAASAIGIANDHTHTPEGKKPYETPRALETEEIPGLIADYRRAAERAQAAGFDGVEVHSANGYLLDTFLQSKTNHRTDAYGGSVENRCRLLREITETVIGVWGPGRVGVRLSPNGAFNDMGSPDYREQFTAAAAMLDGFELAYLHLLDGLAFGFHELGEPMMLAEFRAVFKGPLLANCGYTQQSAEEALARGDADLVAFGRPYISNPDLVERFANQWPLAPDAPMDTWYSTDPAKGYVDFPTYPEKQAAGAA